MEGIMKNAIFERYGMYTVLGYEESDKRGYLTFNCNQGTYMAVMAKHNEDVWFYKYERRINTNED